MPVQTEFPSMKYVLFTIAAAVCAVPVLSAGPDDKPFGSGFMDDLIKPYDDTAIELPGETARKPSVSRSAQLVDDSSTDTWGARGDDSSAPAKKPTPASPSASSSGKTGGSRSSSSASPSRSSSFTADGAYIPYSERYPEQEKEKSESGFDRDTFDPNFNPFKNNYKYGDTNYNPNGTRPEYEETRRKIKDIIGSVPKVMTNEKVDEMIHNPARAATLEAPTTPNRWTHAPNSWFCDYDDVMAKAQQTGKAVAVFFHNSSNDNSRKFKTERMESSKFKSKMRDRLLVLYMDFPQNAGTSKDKRNREQVEHNRRIADKFRVSNYPTVIFLNSSGNEIGRITNMRTLTEFVEEADRIVPQAKPRDNRNSTGFKVGGSISGQGGQNDGQNAGRNGDQGNQNGSQNGGQGGWPQGGGQGGWPGGGQGGWPGGGQGGWPQGGDFGGGFPQGGWPQGGFPGGGFPGGGFPQGGWGN